MQLVEHRCIRARKAGKKKSLNIFVNDAEERVTLEHFQSKSSTLSIKNCHSHRGHKELVHPNCRISRQITSFDEQYLSHCLELIQISAPKAASFNISVTWSPTKTSCPSPGNASNGASMAAAGSGDLVVLSPPNTSNPTMLLDVLPMPLFTNGGFTMVQSPSAKKEPEKRKKHGSDGVPNRDRAHYISSILSTSSDLSSCASTTSAVSHGMLQCTWSNGVPHFMFSMDTKPAVYVARPSNSASSDRNSPDRAYLFHLTTGNRKDSDLVGRMNVSARYRICADNSKILETEFVLYGNNSNLPEMELDNAWKHPWLPGRVSKFLKHGPETNKRGTSASLELELLESDSDSDHTGCPNLSEKNIASNFELAAIVVKEHIQVLQQGTEVSGWGMSFLKNAEEKQATNCHQSSSSTETSMNILVPAGYHGGPKTQNGGPSRLVERWRSGGQCDCGGWDTGCPITVLNTRSYNKEEPNPDPQKQGTKSFDLFLKGRAPWMKMVNVQKGLYYIEFESRLSPLQCFSVAVATIHSTGPCRPDKLR